MKTIHGRSGAGHGGGSPARHGFRWVVAGVCLIAGSLRGAVPTAQVNRPSWITPERPPAGAPNVVLVVIDDVGFGQLGCYGSPLATPNIDRLAAGGVRYTGFNVFPVCSPTRAALLTGRNPHAVGMATITEFANGFPNARGALAPEAATLATLLRARGYGTTALGKWHLVPQHEQHAAAPSTHWPTGAGFDRFYGYLGGDTSQLAPDLFQDRHRVDPPATLRDGSPYFLDADLTDRAIGYLSEHRAAAPDHPFFLYLAYCAGHAPHQAPAEVLARWRGRFEAGWDELRAATLARQKALGLVPAEVQLPPPNPGVRPWTDLSADERRVFARYYEAFAANLEHTDRQFGRLLSHLERLGVAEDTLVILLSDNGASAEGGEHGLWNEMQLFNAQQPGSLAEGLAHYDEMGTARTFGTYPVGWTQAGNTPFRMTKGFVDAGGVRVPLICRWPARIRDHGGIRHQFHAVTDIAATVLDVAGVTPPETVAGVRQVPLHGVSLAYTWDQPAAPGRRTTQYFEIHGRRAIQHDGWKAIARHVPGRPYEEDAWELFDLSHDFAEARNVAATQPERLRALQTVWEREAAAYQVHPLDDRTGARDLLRPVELGGDRTRFVYHPPMTGLHKGIAPDLRGRGFTLSAVIHREEARDGGVIVAQGGFFAGYALWVRDGALVFDYNVSGLERTTIAAPGRLPTGRCEVAVEFVPAASGGGASVTLRVDGQSVFQGSVPRAMPGMISHEPLDVGTDSQTAVSDAYRASQAFQGRIERVEFRLEPARR